MQKWMEDLYSSEEGKRLLEQERLLLETQEAMCELMEKTGVTRAELAKRMGVSSAFVTKLLRGGHNFTLRTLAHVFYCLGRAGYVAHRPIEAAIRSPWDTSGPVVPVSRVWAEPASEPTTVRRRLTETSHGGGHSTTPPRGGSVATFISRLAA